MKLLLTTLFFLILKLSSAQTFSYPTIKNEAQTITDFIPENWTLLDSASGDLNSDKNIDFVFILQHSDSVRIFKTENGYSDPVSTQPRILLIAFRNKLTNKLKLAEQSNSFILNHDNSAMDDPFQSMKIENGILQIDFHLFYNIGSWDVTNTSYKFRYQNNEFVLIGAENNSFNRATHDFENYSYNFLTKKWSYAKRNDNSNQKPKVVWNKLELKELKTLKTFKQPYTWEVTKGIYL